MYKPCCEHPILIVNRAALNYCALGFPLHGVVKHLVSGKFVNSIPLGELIKYAQSHEDDIESCYVSLPNGYKEYLFVYAPCGHCTLCRENKRNDLVFRAAMESACYSCPPFFITLTYAPKYLPHIMIGDKPLYHGNLQYTDVQKFFKRLRKHWDSIGLKHNIRYLVAGEYGSHYGRAHYHIILWNNPYNADEMQPLLFNKLKMDIFNAWGMCEMSAFDIGQCAGGAASYAAKYVSKPSNLHGHHIKPFIHTSRGCGGLGYPLIKQQLAYLRDNPQLRTLTFRGYDGKLISVGFSSYIASKVFPSPSRQIPTKFKELFRQLNIILQHAVSCGIITRQDAINILDDVNFVKHVVPNPYVDICKHRIFGFARTYYAIKFRILIDSIVSELLNIDVPIDIDIDNYLHYKLLTPEPIEQSIAHKRMRVQQRLSNIIETF